MVYRLHSILRMVEVTETQINGKWVPARPHPGFLREKLRGAWLVLTGRADAVIWPEGQ